MARYCILSKALVLLWLNTIVLTHAVSPAPKTFRQKGIVNFLSIAKKFSRDPVTLSLASTDFGHLVHKNSCAVFNPSSIRDISKLIKFSNSLSSPFTIAARGQAHSVHGQAMTQDGVVVNMTALRNDLRNNGSDGIIINTETPTPYVDVGGEQIWIDVLHATLKCGLTLLTWTDYLYLSVGGTLSNAGTSGRSFRFGPLISNVLQMDVVTGKGDLVTCSRKKNPDLFYAVLGGLGQFGIITRARIALGPAPTRVKWLHLLYNNFSEFSRDQERLISLNGRNNTIVVDYVEGEVLLNNSPLNLFYPKPDLPRITSLITKYGIIYSIELVKYYDDNSQNQVDQDIEFLMQRLNFIPTFMFKKDVPYEEFLNRYHPIEELLKSQGLWHVRQPRLHLFVPRSRISNFHEGVLKGIILEQNIKATNIVVHPTDKRKWDDKMSAVTPDESVFYIVSFVHIIGFDDPLLEAVQAQNQHILQFCVDAGIGIKQYLPQYKTHGEWVEHFGPKWNTFQDRKTQFDPNKILSPGQGIFN